MKKRIIALLMAAVLCLGLLAACGEEGEAGGEYITEEKAKEIAINDTYYTEEYVQYLAAEFVDAEEPAYYTVSFVADGMEFVYKIHAVTGEILEYPTFF